MNDFSAFSKMVPGFDFLQGLAQNAQTAMPGFAQWVAPTLDPAEIEKRIGELRTVQFWLEQNVRMVDATVRALEVQRMTLATLKTMNVQMEDVRNALKIPTAPFSAGVPATPPAAPPPAPLAAAPAPAANPAPAVGPIDPLQWWGALTQQFTELATQAMKDTTAEAARHMASAGSSPQDADAAERKGAARKSAAPSRSGGGRGA